MSSSQKIVVGNYLKVKHNSDNPFYGFIENAEIDDVYEQLENDFVSPIDNKDFFFIIPNLKVPDSIIVDSVDCWNEEIEMPTKEWSDGWKIVIDELVRQGKEFEKKYGVLVYVN